MFGFKPKSFNYSPSLISFAVFNPSIFQLFNSLILKPIPPA